MAHPPGAVLYSEIPALSESGRKIHILVAKQIDSILVQGSEKSIRLPSRIHYQCRML